MRELRDAAALVGAVRAMPVDHPWARVCVEGPVRYVGGWATAGAVVWRSGHPWERAPLLHALGPPEAVAAALGRLAQPHERLVVPMGTSVPAELRLGRAHPWTLRLRSTPCVGVPEPAPITWLPADPGTEREVDRLLDVANPHPAVRPGNSIAGRWCGVRIGTELVACAVETMLASPRSHLSSLAVHPAHRGRGLGAAVTAWFVREGLAGGAPEVLLAVDDGNDAGDRLYDGLGFSAWPMIGFYRGEAG